MTVRIVFPHTSTRESFFKQCAQITPEENSKTNQNESNWLFELCVFSIEKINTGFKIIVLQKEK